MAGLILSANVYRRDIGLLKRVIDDPTAGRSNSALNNVDDILSVSLDRVELRNVQPSSEFWHKSNLIGDAVSEWFGHR